MLRLDFETFAVILTIYKRWEIVYYLHIQIQRFTNNKWMEGSILHFLSPNAAARHFGDLVRASKLYVCGTKIVYVICVFRLP